MIEKVLVLDKNTNDEIIDLCTLGIKFKDLESVRKLLEYSNFENCNHVKVFTDDNGEEWFEEFYYEDNILLTETGWAIEKKPPKWI